MSEESKTPTKKYASQTDANRRQDAKRKAKNLPRLPSGHITHEQGELLKTLYKMFDGQKKNAVLTAAKFYIDNHSK